MDIENYFQRLDDNTNRLLSKLGSLTESQLHYKADATWTIIEVAEHIWLTENLVTQMLLLPSESRAEGSNIIGDEKLQRLVVQMRSRKIKAPQRLEPSGRFKTIDQLESEFRKSRNELKKSLTEARLLITNAIYKHPMLGEMTVSDWLYFLVHHSERHIKQIEDLISEKN